MQKYVIFSIVSILVLIIYEICILSIIFKWSSKENEYYEYYLILTCSI